jgi:hypothetical protein
MVEQIIDLGEQSSQTKRQRSGMATASLICALILCCPIVTLIGVILGIVALLRMRGKGLTGRGLAWAGIIIGLVVTVLSSLFLYVATNVGIAGDMESFRSEFTHGAIGASDEEITSFVEILTERFGVFDQAVIDMATIQSAQQPLSNEPELPIQLVFETKTVSAIAVFTIVEGTETLIDIQIQCLSIHDPDNGDIAFPLASLCSSSVSESETKTDEN